ncbi:MAG: hypothetical protein ACP5NX_00015 [Candidatus Bilamarchaeaceae archaeon]
MTMTKKPKYDLSKAGENRFALKGYLNSNAHRYMQVAILEDALKKLDGRIADCERAGRAGKANFLKAEERRLREKLETHLHNIPVAIRTMRPMAEAIIKERVEWIEGQSAYERYHETRTEKEGARLMDCPMRARLSPDLAALLVLTEPGLHPSAVEKAKARLDGVDNGRLEHLVQDAKSIGIKTDGARIAGLLGLESGNLIGMLLEEFVRQNLVEIWGNKELIRKMESAGYAIVKRNYELLATEGGSEWVRKFLKKEGYELLLTMDEDEMLAISLRFIDYTSSHSRRPQAPDRKEDTAVYDMAFRIMNAFRQKREMNEATIRLMMKMKKGSNRDEVRLFNEAMKLLVACNALVKGKNSGYYLGKPDGITDTKVREMYPKPTTH